MRTTLISGPQFVMPIGITRGASESTSALVLLLETLIDVVRVWPGHQNLLTMLGDSAA